MGLPRLYGYVLKYFPDAFQDICAVNESFVDSKFPKGAVYLVDATNFLNLKARGKDGKLSTLWEAAAPMLRSLALDTLRSRSEEIHPSMANTVILFYDQRGNSEEKCKAFQASVHKEWAKLHKEIKSKSEKSLTCNVYICKNASASADRHIFLTLQRLQKMSNPPAAVILSNDSDMLLSGLLHADTCDVSVVCALPPQRSLFFRRASGPNSEVADLRWHLIQASKFHKSIPPSQMPSFAVHVLLLLGTSTSSTGVIKRYRSQESYSNLFAGLLTHHKDDITIYSALHASWKAVQRMMTSRPHTAEKPQMLVSIQDDSIVLHTQILHDVMLDLGPSIALGSDSRENAKRYISNAAMSLAFLATGNRDFPKLTERLMVPSLCSLCNTFKEKPQLKCSFHVGKQLGMLKFSDASGSDVKLFRS